MHQVAAADVPANEWVPGVTEDAEYSTDASRKLHARVPVNETGTKINIKKAPQKNKYIFIYNKKNIRQ